MRDGRHVIYCCLFVIVEDEWGRSLLLLCLLRVLLAAFAFLQNRATVVGEGGAAIKRGVTSLCGQLFFLKTDFTAAFVAVPEYEEKH